MAKRTPRPTINIDEVEIPESDDEEVEEKEDETFSGSISPRSMVKYMADSMAKALDRRDKANALSVNISTADPGNINAVPSRAPNTGMLALRSVPNTMMADGLGVAPTPNMMIEGDPTSLDVQKITKHIKSGCKHTPGEFLHRQATCPEKLLSANAPNFGKLDHDILAFDELMDGMLAKLAVETQPLNLEVENKLSYMRELVSMHSLT